MITVSLIIFALSNIVVSKAAWLYTKEYKPEINKNPPILSPENIAKHQEMFYKFVSDIDSALGTIFPEKQEIQPNSMYDESAEEKENKEMQEEDDELLNYRFKYHKKKRGRGRFRPTLNHNPQLFKYRTLECDNDNETSDCYIEQDPEMNDDDLMFDESAELQENEERAEQDENVESFYKKDDQMPDVVSNPSIFIPSKENQNQWKQLFYKFRRNNNDNKNENFEVVEKDINGTINNTPELSTESETINNTPELSTESAANRNTTIHFEKCKKDNISKEIIENFASESENIPPINQIQPGPELIWNDEAGLLENQQPNKEQIEPPKSESENIPPINKIQPGPELIWNDEAGLLENQQPNEGQTEPTKFEVSRDEIKTCSPQNFVSRVNDQNVPKIEIYPNQDELTFTKEQIGNKIILKVYKNVPVSQYSQY